MDKGSFRTGGLARGATNLGRILTVALQIASAMAYMHVRVNLHSSPSPTCPDPWHRECRIAAFCHSITSTPASTKWVGCFPPSLLHPCRTPDGSVCPVFEVSRKHFVRTCTSYVIPAQGRVPREHHPLFASVKAGVSLLRQGMHHGNLTPSNVMLALPNPASHIAKTGVFLVAKVSPPHLSDHAILCRPPSPPPPPPPPPLSPPPLLTCTCTHQCCPPVLSCKFDMHATKSDAW